MSLDSEDIELVEQYLYAWQGYANEHWLGPGTKQKKKSAVASLHHPQGRLLQYKGNGVRKSRTLQFHGPSCSSLGVQNMEHHDRWRKQNSSNSGVSFSSIGVTKSSSHLSRNMAENLEWRKEIWESSPEVVVSIITVFKFVREIRKSRASNISRLVISKHRWRMR